MDNIGDDKMPTKVKCPWILCLSNSKYRQRGEVGECNKDVIELVCPDQDMPEHPNFEPVSNECCVEVDDLLVCMQFNR